MIDFINGDPDRPIITGRVYNDASMPPWALPASATQMGFLSRSKDGTADNANALRFEDKNGEEQVWVQAERNMDVNVKNDATRAIGGSHSHYVAINELHRVETNRVHGVKGEEVLVTGADKSDSAAGTYTWVPAPRCAWSAVSAIELHANGQINLVGKGFNLFVDGEGFITTSGDKLYLNASGASAGTNAPGTEHKANITKAVDNIFPAKKS